MNFPEFGRRHIRKLLNPRLYARKSVTPKKTTILMKTCILVLALSVGFAQVKAGDGAKDHNKNTPAVRNILSNQLPARLLTNIKKNYKDYWITDLYRENLNGKVSYYITLENPDQTVRLNTNHTAGWSVGSIVPKDPGAR